MTGALMNPIFPTTHIIFLLFKGLWQSQWHMTTLDHQMERRVQTGLSKQEINIVVQEAQNGKAQIQRRSHMMCPCKLNLWKW